MTGWGDVLEAMHLAPRGVRTVRLVVEQRHEGAVIPGQPPSTAVSGDAGTTILTARSMTTATVTMVSAGAASEDDPPWRTELWYEAGSGRYRLLRAGTTTVVDGTHRWTEWGDGRVVRAEIGAQPDQERLLLLVIPEVLLGWFRYEDHDEATVLDRPVHWLRGTRRHTPLGAMLDFLVPGETADTIIDATTGVVLELQLRSGGSPSSSMHVTECGFDDFDPDELLVYRPAPGARVLTPAQLHAELIGQHRGPGASPMTPAARPPLAETTMPIGPPPDDIDGATSAIRYAVEHLTDIDDDDRCPNIQGGANLADCVRQTHRSPFVDEDQGATFECGEIAFVRADEADVRFRVVVPLAPGGGIDTQGRALLIDGRWVVDRATACGLFSMAGVTCPPPPPAD